MLIISYTKPIFINIQLTRSPVPLGRHSGVKCSSPKLQRGMRKVDKHTQ